MKISRYIVILLFIHMSIVFLVSCKASETPFDAFEEAVQTGQPASVSLAPTHGKDEVKPDASEKAVSDDQEVGVKQMEQPAVAEEASIDLKTVFDDTKGQEIVLETEAPVQQETSPEQPGVEEAAAEVPIPEKQASETVKISVYGIDYCILAETEIEYVEGQTVFDILKQAAKENSILLDFKGRGTTTYILGIDNVYEFDMGPESGWVYSVNDVYATASCGAYQVKKGDSIAWIYKEKMEKGIF